MTVCAQELGCGDGRSTLGLRGLGQAFAIATAVRFTGMGQHATQVEPGVGQDACDLHQIDVVRREAAAMAVTIVLDQHTRHLAAMRRGGRQRQCLIGCVEHHLDVGAALAQRDDARDLVGREAYRIGCVGEAVSREIFGFLDGRNRDRSALILEETPHDIDRLGRLDVRSKRDTESSQMLRQARDVALRLVHVEDQRGRVERRDRVSHGSEY